MKLFIVGDYKSGTGPANITQAYIHHLEGVLFQTFNNKLLRLLEIFLKTMFADVIIFSGLSAQNIPGIKLAHLFRKPSFYLMHGCVWYENQLNHISNPREEQIERQILETTDYILAVSIQFASWLKAHYPDYADKIYHITNGIDWEKLSRTSLNQPAACPVPHQIISIGGGLPLKNILSVCKAIDLIYQESSSCNIQLLVIGAQGDDSAAIQKYPFVQDLGILSHEQVLSHMAKSQLYIQNSIFETFGLAPLEALLQGCSLLLSKQVGAISLLQGTEDTDIIEDPYNISELKEKITYRLIHPNNHRLSKSLDPSGSSAESRCQELLALIQHLVTKHQ